MTGFRKEHQLIIKTQGGISVTHNYHTQYEPDHLSDFGVICRTEKSKSRAGMVTAALRLLPGETPTHASAALPASGLGSAPIKSQPK